MKGVGQDLSYHERLTSRLKGGMRRIDTRDFVSFFKLELSL